MNTIPGNPILHVYCSMQEHTIHLNMPLYMVASMYGCLGLGQSLLAIYYLQCRYTAMYSHSFITCTYTTPVTHIDTNTSIQTHIYTLHMTHTHTYIPILTMKYQPM